MKSVEGDLIKLALAGQFDVIVHGCNCFNTMGAGIARSIKVQLPEAYTADCQTVSGDKAKLGTFSVATLTRANTQFDVINAYTQFDYRGRGPRVNYDAVKSCFEKIAEQYPEARIGYPQIGSGLAGGDWGKISGIIDQALMGLDHTVVIFRSS